MDAPYTYDQTFKGLKELPKGEYEQCAFTHCRFSGVDLSYRKFTDCEFVECDLSNANITGITCSGVEFSRCKLLGLRFDTVNEYIFDAAFFHCSMDMSNFSNVRLLKSQLKNCSCKHVDFGGAELKECSFQGTNFEGALFERTDLSQCDFREAHNYIIDPKNNQISKARFSREYIDGLLTQFNIKIE